MKKKVNGVLFEKGHKRTPNAGRPKLSPEIRDFRKASLEDIIIEYKYLWSRTEDELEYEIACKETPAIRRWMAKVIYQGVNGTSKDRRSNLRALEIIFDRIYGKARTPIDLDGGSVHFQLAKIFGDAAADKKK